jgi:cytochrome c oxidase subunit 2
VAIGPAIRRSGGVGHTDGTGPAIGVAAGRHRASDRSDRPTAAGRAGKRLGSWTVLPRRPRATTAVVLTTGAAFGLVGCSSKPLPRFGAPPGATRQSQDFLHLWRGTFIVAIAVGALVWGLIIWSIVRYRKRPGDDSLPKQTRYHIPLEVTYTAVPIIIVAFIFGFVVPAENRIDHVSKNPSVIVKVEGFQWGWRFSYLRPDGSEIGNPVVGTQLAPPTLVLPEGQTVRLNLLSDDVIHSFFVPDFVFKRDLIPGVNNNVDLFIDKTGTFTGQCAEFCGLFHANMTFTVKAVTRQQFDSMLAGASA